MHMDYDDPMTMNEGVGEEGNNLDGGDEEDEDDLSEGGDEDEK